MTRVKMCGMTVLGLSISVYEKLVAFGQRNEESSFSITRQFDLRTEIAALARTHRFCRSTQVQVHSAVSISNLPARSQGGLARYPQIGIPLWKRTRKAPGPPQAKEMAPQTSSCSAG